MEYRTRPPNRRSGLDNVCGDEKPAPNPKIHHGRTCHDQSTVGSPTTLFAAPARNEQQISRAEVLSDRFDGSNHLISLEKSAVMAIRCSENLQRISSGFSLQTCCCVIELHAMHQARPRLPGRLGCGIQAAAQPGRRTAPAPTATPAAWMCGLHIAHRCFHICFCTNLGPPRLVHDPTFRSAERDLA